MIVHNPNKLPTASIADLLPTQGELKDLSTENYKKLKKNIERRGFIDPVAVWEDKNGIKYILNGHQRQRVLTNEGWLEPIPYFNVPAKTLQEAAAIVLELTSQYGKITQEGLDAHIAKYDLPEAEIYEATHFDALSFYDTSEPEQDVEEDEAPEVDESEPPKSKLGEIYQLGRHRVMCGDSTNEALIGELISNTNIDIVFTDPPYNVAFNGRSGKHDVIKNDNISDIEFEKLIDGMCKVINYVQPKAYYIWCNWKFYGLLQKKLDYKACIVWAKNVFGMGQGYRHQHEFCLFNGKIDDNIKNESDLWDVAKDTNYQHPTQKPVALSVRAFSNHITYTDILDLFGGSGSTLIGAEQTGRTAYLMELDPKYVDVIRKRYAKFIQPDDQLPENWEELTPAIND